MSKSRFIADKAPICDAAAKVEESRPVILRYDVSDKRKMEFYAADRRHRFGFLTMNHGLTIVGGLDEKGEMAALEEGYTCKIDDALVDSKRTLKGMFAVAWFDNYTVSYKGKPILAFKSMRQHEVQVLG
jgi:hypothetical protein